MIYICCTNKIIIRTIHKIPDLFYFSRYFIYIFLWRNSSLLCLYFIFLSMFIRSCLEINIIPFLSFKSCNCICQNNLIRISNVWFTGSIGNCCCHIKLSFICHVINPFFSMMQYKVNHS